MADNHEETRQERREKKLLKKKEQMKQHGKGLGSIYEQIVLKRADKGREIDKTGQK